MYDPSNREPGGGGGRILFSIMHQTFLRIQFSVCIVTIHSDVLAGMSMSFVSFLDETIAQRKGTFIGSILVRSPNKSAASLGQLNQQLLSDIGIVDGDRITGEGFVLIVDIISLFYRFMTLEKFQHVTVKYRPLLIPACFTIMNNDYIPPCHGLKYVDFFETISSGQYKYATEAFGNDRCSPLSCYSPIIFGECLPKSATCFRLSGMQLMFAIMMASRGKAKTRMLRS